MAMSRKHYREVAKIINDAVESSDSPDGDAVARQIAAELARMFKADNPNFRREQFMDACGL